jgi:hypothetical protein
VRVALARAHDHHALARRHPHVVDLERGQLLAYAWTPDGTVPGLS